jgi:hypothetical protein
MTFSGGYGYDHEQYATFPKTDDYIYKDRNLTFASNGLIKHRHAYVDFNENWLKRVHHKRGRFDSIYLHNPDKPLLEIERHFSFYHYKSAGVYYDEERDVVYYTLLYGHKHHDTNQTVFHLKECIVDSKGKVLLNQTARHFFTGPLSVANNEIKPAYPYLPKGGDLQTRYVLIDIGNGLNMAKKVKGKKWAKATSLIKEQNYNATAIRTTDDFSVILTNSKPSFFKLAKFDLKSSTFSIQEISLLDHFKSALVVPFCREMLVPINDTLIARCFFYSGPGNNYLIDIHKQVPQTQNRIGKIKKIFVPLTNEDEFTKPCFDLVDRYLFRKTLSPNRFFQKFATRSKTQRFVGFSLWLLNRDSPFPIRKKYFKDFYDQGAILFNKPNSDITYIVGAQKRKPWQASRHMITIPKGRNMFFQETKGYAFDLLMYRTSLLVYYDIDQKAEFKITDVFISDYEEGNPYLRFLGIVVVTVGLYLLKLVVDCVRSKKKKEEKEDEEGLEVEEIGGNGLEESLIQSVDESFDGSLGL